jgi:hypothetical protein
VRRPEIFEKSPLLDLTFTTVKSKVEISQNFVAFSEYLNFAWYIILLLVFYLPYDFRKCNLSDSFKPADNPESIQKVPYKLNLISWTVIEYKTGTVNSEYTCQSKQQNPVHTLWCRITVLHAYLFFQNLSHQHALFGTT